MVLEKFFNLGRTVRDDGAAPHAGAARLSAGAGVVPVGPGAQGAQAAVAPAVAVQSLLPALQLALLGLEEGGVVHHDELVHVGQSDHRDLAGVFGLRRERRGGLLGVPPLPGSDCLLLSEADRGRPLC